MTAQPFELHEQPPLVNADYVSTELRKRWEESYRPGVTETQLGLRYTQLQEVAVPGRHRLLVLNEAEQQANNFKINGVRFALAQALAKDPNLETVYVGSAGNAAASAAVATAGTRLRLVVETLANLVPEKRQLMESPHVEIHADHDTVETACAVTQQSADQDPRGLYLHPYNDLDMIAGQGMVAKRTMASLFAMHDRGDLDIYRDNIVLLEQ